MREERKNRREQVCDHPAERIRFLTKLLSFLLPFCKLRAVCSVQKQRSRHKEEAYDEGKVRAIGVSNFYPDRYLDLEHFAEVKPMVNQVETHVFQQQKMAREYMEKHGTQIMSWGPFAEGRNEYFTNPVLKEIGEHHGKSVAQTALRFLLQENVVVIPKSVHRDRMEENYDVFDFTLTPEEMERIRALDGGKSLFFSHHDPETVEWFMSLL